jgi:DNA replication licensing factor MCM5
VKQYYCDIDIAHLIVYNDELAQNLTQNPAEVIPLVCAGVESNHQAKTNAISSKPL